jgi:MerR family transcriptional regulator, redox-sensitive transcriptional activator SoxR
VRIKAVYLTIGEVSRRSGVTASALRFYERRGLIRSTRSEGNHRMYHREMLRRISVIRVAQTLGLTLNEILEAMCDLPDQRTPTKRDWERLSKKWQGQLDERIAQMQRMRDKLTRCIGCGCLSLKTCTLHNREDYVAVDGAGPRFLLYDYSDDK